MVKTKVLAASLLTCAFVAAGCATKAKDSNPPPASQSSAGATALSAKGTSYAIKQDGSKVEYSVGERFLAQERDAVAVGTTSSLVGDLVVNGGKLAGGKVTVDLRTLKSDSDRRDSYIKSNTLETAKYPNAEYEITGLEGDTPLKEGEPVGLKVKGQMTVHGTTKPFIFDAKVTLRGNAIDLTANTTFKMSDFGVKPPNVLGFVVVKDDVKLTVQVKATK